VVKIGREYTRKTGEVDCLNCGNTVEAEKKQYIELFKVDCDSCGKTYYLDEYQMYEDVGERSSE
jgi:DNA-directed RNA polymerase subunit M/transcription elongation factor TFIIS